MKNKLVIIILLALFAGGVYAQNGLKNLPGYDYKKYHFGFTLGLNVMNMYHPLSNQSFYSVPSDPKSPQYQLKTEIESPSPGVSVGLIASYRINDYFNLRFVPSIALGQRTFSFVENPKVNTHEDIKVKSTYIELPFLIKYKSVRTSNARPYMIAGPNVRFDLGRKKSENLVLKPVDIALEMGLGSDFYLEEFRLGVEIRFSLGLTDVLLTDLGGKTEQEDTQYTESLDGLFSRFFILAFNFE